MINYLKVSEAPKTKLQLKKAILNGSIIVSEKDMNSDMPFRILEKTSSIINLWEGFRYAPKYQGDSNTATAYIGTSFYYKFSVSL